MRLRRNPKARPELAACSFFVDFPAELLGHWHDQFCAKRPLYIELGCGRGEFIAKYACMHPELNFLAVDIKSEVLFHAKRNAEAEYAFAGREINNLLFTGYDIERIDTALGPCDAADCIIISFCNPWSHNRHKKRRLTHTKQLLKYRLFLKDSGIIMFRTDDEGLFNESFAYFREAGYEITESCFDTPEDSAWPASEHERRFRAEGKPIMSLKAVKRPL